MYSLIHHPWLVFEWYKIRALHRSKVISYIHCNFSDMGDSLRCWEVQEDRFGFLNYIPSQCPSEFGMDAIKVKNINTGELKSKIVLILIKQTSKQTKNKQTNKTVALPCIPSVHTEPGYFFTRALSHYIEGDMQIMCVISGLINNKSYSTTCKLTS